MSVVGVSVASTEYFIDDPLVPMVIKQVHVKHHAFGEVYLDPDEANDLIDELIAAVAEIEESK